MARASALVLHLIAAPCAASLLACTHGTPSKGSRPDADRILIFYPVDGLVQGRGLEGTFPPDVSRVFVRAHPGGARVIQHLGAGGSFRFALTASSGDAIEIAAVLDERGTERGEAVFLEVPPTPIQLIPEEFVCCAATAHGAGTCQSSAQARDGAPCPTVGARDCRRNEDCGVLEGEYLLVDPDTFTVTPPNEDGMISVSGQVQPSTLIQMENRALTALGEPSPVRRTAQLTDRDGRFALNRIRARGDDELVFRVLTLGGFRSAEVARLVPDSPLAGVDIIGVFPLDQAPLTNGARGEIAVLVAPYGIDQRGLCPDSAVPGSPEWTQVCFTGGLTHDMVELSSFTLDGLDLDARVAAPTPERPLRGRIGDVRAGPLDVVVALDMSAAAESKAAFSVRREVVETFIRNARQRDRVGIALFGLTPAPDHPGGTRRLLHARERDSGLRGADARDELLTAVGALSAAAGAPKPNLFAAVEEASRMLTDAESSRGRIIVLAGQEPRLTPDDRRAAFDAALAAVGSNASGPRFVVDIVGLDLAPGDPDYDPLAVNGMQDLTFFSEGRYLETVARELDQTFADLRATMYGGVALLYDVFIGPTVGKSGNIQLSLEVALKGGAERATASYQGPLRVLFSDRP